MLPQNLIPLIDVTFSTPTRVNTQNSLRTSQWVKSRCYASLPHSWMCAILTAPSSFPTLHTNSSPHTPSSIAQMPAHLCNVPAQFSAPSTSSLNSPPAHQSLPPASSPGAIPQTQSPSSDPPRLPLPESLRSPRA